MFDDNAKEYLIPFTQYLLPDGRRRDEHYRTTNKDLYERSQKITDVFKARYEAEILRTGHVSVTIHYNNEDIAIAICENGPGISDAIEKITNDALKFLETKGESTHHM